MARPHGWVGQFSTITTGTRQSAFLPKPDIERGGETLRRSLTKSAENQGFRSSQFVMYPVNTPPLRHDQDEQEHGTDHRDQHASDHECRAIKIAIALRQLCRRQFTLNRHGF